MSKKKHLSKYAILMSLLFLGFVVVEGGLILLAIWIMERFHIFSNEVNIMYVVAAIVASIVLGFVSTYFINKFTMKNVEEFKEVIVDVANGDYSKTNEELKLPLYKDISVEFNKMLKEINSSYILRQDFVNNVSHEIKTPLVSILGYAELIKEAPDLSIEERNMYLDIIISEVKRLSNLSSEAMMMSKLDSMGIIDVDSFRLDNQLEECILLLDNELKKKNIAVDIDLEVAKVKANKDLLKEVWLNILSNAIKYSPNDSLIKIKLQADEKIKVMISDNGIGMDEETIKHIFEKYYRGSNDKKIPGIGLGLSITKKIIEISGGQINVESKIGEGSTFTVLLPKE